MSSVRLLLNIDVNDLDRAIAFYTTAFGLRLERVMFEGTVAELGGASSMIYLLSKSEGTAPHEGSSVLRDYARHWTPVHMDFCVEDVKAAVSRAVGAGATLESAIQSYPWGQLATLSDPFGHGVCLIQFSPMGYDAA